MTIEERQVYIDDIVEMIKNYFYEKDIDKAHREYVQDLHNRCTPCDSIEEAFEKAINEFRALINKKEK